MYRDMKGVKYAIFKYFGDKCVLLQYYGLKVYYDVYIRYIYDPGLLMLL